MINSKIIGLLELGWVDGIGDEQILYPFLEEPVFP